MIDVPIYNNTHYLADGSNYNSDNFYFLDSDGQWKYLKVSHYEHYNNSEELFKKGLKKLKKYYKQLNKDVNDEQD